MKIVMTVAAIGSLVVSNAAWAQSATPLRDLLSEASRSNPDILAAQHSWRAATHLQQQVTALPNPQLTVQSFSVGSPEPFAGFKTSNFAYIGIGASQELPYPGKLRLKGEAADRAAQAQQARIGVVAATITEQIKLSYLQLAYLQQTLRLLESSRNTLGQVVESELLRYRTGGGSQADVLRAQLQRTKLLKEITLRHEQMGELQADLKRLLHRAQDSPDIVAEDLTMTALRYSPDELINFVHQQNPEVKWQATTVQKEIAVLRSTERAGKPDFSIGYMFQRTGDDFPAYYMLTFNVLFQRKQRVRGEVAEAAESLESARQQLSAQTDQQAAEVKKQYVAAKSTAEELAEYRNGIIPQADAVFQAVRAGYEANQAHLSSVLNALNDVLDLKRDYAQALLDHEMAVARLETLTGETLR